MERTRSGREQRCRGRPARIEAVRRLLDDYEALWRDRFAAMDALLATGDGPLTES